MATLRHAKTYPFNVQVGIAQSHVDQKRSISSSFRGTH